MVERVGDLEIRPSRWARLAAWRWSVPAAVAAVLLLAAGLLVADAWNDSLTEDEVTHLQAGACALATGRLSVDETNPPLFKLLAAPAALALGDRPSCAAGSTDVFPRHDPDRLRRLTFFSRLPAILLTLATGVAVLAWARAMLGPWPGVAALTLFLMEPTVLGHGHLVTGDMPVTLGTVLCLGGHWAWTHTGRGRWLLVSGAGLGIGLLSKSSALQLFGVLVLIEGLELVRARGAQARVRSAEGGRANPAQGGATPKPRPALALGVIAVVAYLLVIVVHLPFGHAETAFNWHGPPAVIFPPSWWYGVLWQAGHVQAGHVAYVNGAVHQHGVWYYFLEALALKASFPLLFLALTGIGYLRTAAGRDLQRWVLLPAVALVALASAGGIDIGVRYILPVFPLLAIVGALSVTPEVWDDPGLRARSGKPPLSSRSLAWARWGTAGVLLLAPLTAVLSARGHIGFFNYYADRPERSLSDSNLDWGQDAWRLRDWWLAHGRPAMTNTYFSQLPLSAYGIDSETVSPTSEPPGNGLWAISLTHATAFGRGADCPYTIALVLPDQTRVGTSIIVTHIDGLLPPTPPGPDATCL